VLSIIVAFFLAAPILILIPMSLSTSSLLAFPPPGFSFHYFHVFFTDPIWEHSIWLSVRVACGAAVVAIVTGGLASYGLVRGRVIGTRFFEAVFMLPLVVPAVIFAAGAYLIELQFGLVGSIWILLAAHSMLALPFVVVFMGSALRTADPRLAVAAQTLGASRPNAFRLVTMPLIRPALIACALLTLVLSLDETVVALFLTSTTAPTLPVNIYNSIQYQLDPEVPVAAMVIVGGSAVIGIVFMVARSLLGAGRTRRRVAGIR
jgi:putative spermidine/putrescine transport system permease protein